MQYLKHVLDLLKERAHMSAHVDWDSFYARAEAIHEDVSPIEGYPIIREAIAALGDNHSFFVGADERDETGPTGRPKIYGASILSPEFIVTEIFTNTPAEKAGLERRDLIELINGEAPQAGNGRRLQLSTDEPITLQINRDGKVFELTMEAESGGDAPLPHGCVLSNGIGYLELFVQGDPNEAQKYIDKAQDVIREGVAAGVQGWIVDLRCNRGGNMWPMIAGSGALMGEGMIGKFVGNEGDLQEWYYQDGASQYRDHETGEMNIVNQASNPVPPLDPQSTAVAVLQSDLTGSSGEMTLIAFRGRPNTRTFGESTTGLTTAVAMQELEDKAILGIAESVCADRSGTVYSSVVEPDEAVKIDWRRYGLDDDPLMLAASTWIQKQLALIQAP